MGLGGPRQNGLSIHSHTTPPKPYCIYAGVLHPICRVRPRGQGGRPGVGYRCAVWGYGFGAYGVQYGIHCMTVLKLGEPDTDIE